MWGGLCGARFSLLKEMFPALFIVCVCVCVCVCVFVCVKWWRVQSLGEVFSYQLGVKGYFTVCVCVCVCV